MENQNRNISLKKKSAQCFCLYRRYKFNKNCNVLCKQVRQEKHKNVNWSARCAVHRKIFFFIFRKYQFVQSDHDECDRERYTWSNTWCKFHRIFRTIYRIFSWKKKCDTRAGRWCSNRIMSIFNEFNLNMGSTGWIYYVYFFLFIFIASNIWSYISSFSLCTLFWFHLFPSFVYYYHIYIYISLSYTLVHKYIWNFRIFIFYFIAVLYADWKI